MTSRNLFFKLMREDLKRRIWAVALLSLGFFLFYPVVAAFTAGEIKEYMNHAKGVANYEMGLVRWLSFNCGMTVFLMMVSSLICGLSSFSFLNSKSKVDFYHGIPVRREKLFAVNFLDGILILAVPYGICQVLAVLVGISNGASGIRLWQVALAAFGLHITYFILMYATVVVAAMMTGHLVIGFLGTIVFASYMPMAVGILTGYLSSFFHTYASYLPGIFSERVLMYGIRMSPVAEYIYQLGRNGEQYQVPAPMAVPVLIAWAASLGLAVLACMMYRRRPSEAAGKAMAFSVSCPVVRILLTMLSALGLGLFFYAVRSSMGWAIFGIVFGGGICHCVVEIIYHFDFRKLFSHKLQMACCMAASVLILAVFRYDLLGYDRYLPKAGQIREASVNVSTLTNWVSYGHTWQYPDGHYEWVNDYSPRENVLKNMKYHDTENLLALASAGIESLEEDERDIYRKDVPWSQVEICYTLNSGRKVSRVYHMPVYDGEVQPAIRSLYENEEFQRGVFPLLSMTTDQVSSVRFRGEYGEDEKSKKEIRLNKLSEQEKALLLETYQKELLAMTVEKMETEAPVGLIRFSRAADDEAMDWWAGQEALGEDAGEWYRENGGYRSWARDDISDRDFYPVYPSFTETIKLLEAQGIQCGGYLDGLDARAVRVELNDNFVRAYQEHIGNTDPDFFDEEYRAMTSGARFHIRDKEKVMELRGMLVSRALCYYDPFFRAEDLDVYLMAWKPETQEDIGKDYEDGEEGDWNLSVPVSFPKGMAPEYIWDRVEN